MTQFRLWYLAQSSIGIVGWIGVAILLNPIIIERTESGMLLGQVMALIGGAGVLAPVIGAVADKYACHRLLQRCALLINLAALVVLYFSQSSAVTYWLVGALMGIAIVTLLVLNPTFVIAHSDNQQEEGRSLAKLFQFQFLGVVVSGVLIALADHYQLTTEVKLQLLMVLLVIIIITVFIAPPAPISAKSTELTESEKTQAPLKRAFLPWALFLLSAFCSMFLSANLMELGPLLVKEVYNVEIGNSALGMATSAAICIFLLEPAGRWMQKSGPFKVWLTAQGIFLVLGLIFWSTVGMTVPEILPVALLVILIQAMSWNDLAVPAIAVRLSPTSPALTQGMLMFAMAGGFGGGTLLAGICIDVFGYASVFTLSLVGIVLSLTFIALIVLTGHRRQLQSG